MEVEEATRKLRQGDLLPPPDASRLFIIYFIKDRW